MRKSPRLLLAVALSTTALALPGASATAAISRPTPNCNPATQQGTLPEGQLSDLKDTLTASEKEVIADNAGLTNSQLDAHLHDESVHVNSCGTSFITEPAHVATNTGGTNNPERAAHPLGNTFQLSSLPSAEKTIYLDFDGSTITGTGWNMYDLWGSPSTITMSPYSLDSQRGFSDTELAAIQQIWAQVADDYAPFNVNVTTRKPPESDIQRTNSADRRYGVTVVVGLGAGDLQKKCRCAGIAYLDTWSTTGEENRLLQPALVFSDASSSINFTANAISHEVGHTLGLSHDGNGRLEYYPGANSWSPIMGNGSGPLSHWSKGDYPGATNKEDDIATLGRVLGYAPTTRRNTLATATPVPLRAGVGAITSLLPTSSSSDLYSFNTVGGPTTLTAKPTTAGVGTPNLDPQLEILDSSGAVLHTAKRSTANSCATGFTGLDATWTGTLPAGKYYARVKPTTSSADWTSYGAVGRYSLTISTPATQALTALPKQVTVTRGGTYKGKLEATGGSSAKRWSLVSGAPLGMRVDSAGNLAGLALAAPGAYSVITRVTSGSLTATATTNVTVLSSRTLGVPASQELSAPIGVARTFRLTPATTQGADVQFTGGCLPFWASVTPEGLLTVTPRVTSPQTLSVQMRVNDQVETLSIAVSGTTGTGLSAEPNPTAVAKTGTAFATQLTASNGTKPTWKLLTGPKWLTLSPSGVLSGTPTATGRHSYLAQVSDATGAQTAVPGSVTAYSSRALTVTDVRASGLEGTSTTARTTYDSSTGLQPTFALVSPPQWARINSTTGAVTLKFQPPKSSRNLTGVLTVRGIKQAFNITVAPVGKLRVSSQNVTVKQGAKFQRRVTFTGGSGTPTYSLSGAPKGVVISRSGVISGKFTQAKTFTLKAKVRSGTQAQTATVKVKVTRVR